MNARSLRLWSCVHRWSSIVCTAFILLLCLTALPLIFRAEITHLLGTKIEAPAMPAPMPRVGLDEVLKAAKALHPGKDGAYVSTERNVEDVWFVTLADDVASEAGVRRVAIDARTGNILAEPKPDEGFMYVMYNLHVNLFAGLPGSLFLGAMALLLCLAIVSGVVLYGPFMRKLAFGTVRGAGAPRTRWLDIHNLLGIVTMVWATVIALTGAINTLADPIIDHWRTTEVADMIKPYAGRPRLQTLASLEKSVQAALESEPGMTVGIIAFPGTKLSSPYHYAVFLRGASPVTQRLYKPVLVDAETAAVTESRSIPWYAALLLLSQPLHFGDYGGKFMQIIWALLDLVTIVILGSGLFLWLKRGGAGGSAMRETRLINESTMQERG